MLIIYSSFHEYRVESSIQEHKGSCRAVLCCKDSETTCLPERVKTRVFDPRFYLGENSKKSSFNDKAAFIGIQWLRYMVVLPVELVVLLEPVPLVEPVLLVVLVLRVVPVLLVVFVLRVVPVLLVVFVLLVVPVLFVLRVVLVLPVVIPSVV